MFWPDRRCPGFFAVVLFSSNLPTPQLSYHENLPYPSLILLLYVACTVSKLNTEYPLYAVKLIFFDGFSQNILLKNA